MTRSLFYEHVGSGNSLERRLPSMASEKKLIAAPEAKSDERSGAAAKRIVQSTVEAIDGQPSQHPSESRVDTHLEMSVRLCGGEDTQD